ncbi:MAG: hypothetical protein IIB00_07300, partial [candidate division Zixibacteria bacterium]|nr:hypothetical protein [candidate division Zixibacteria bacterium]
TVSASRGSQRERSSGSQGAGERRTGRGGSGCERRGGRDRERSPRREGAQRGERSSRYERRERSPRRDDRDSRDRGATGRGHYQSRPRPERDTRKRYDKEETRQAPPAPAQKSESSEATIDFGQLSQPAQRSSGFTSGTESSEFNIEINVPEIDFANDPALKSGGPSDKDDDTLIEKQEVPESDQAHVPEKLDERETEKPATSESIEENQGQQEDSFGRTKKRKPGA